VRATTHDAVRITHDEWHGQAWPPFLLSQESRGAADSHYTPGWPFSQIFIRRRRDFSANRKNALCTADRLWWGTSNRLRSILLGNLSAVRVVDLSASGGFIAGFHLGSSCQPSADAW